MHVRCESRAAPRVGPDPTEPDGALRGDWSHHMGRSLQAYEAQSSPLYLDQGALDLTKTRPSVADKRRTFRRLHEAGCFVIPNPWDVGGALYLQSLGFEALATTSS